MFSTCAQDYEKYGYIINNKFSTLIEIQRKLISEASGKNLHPRYPLGPLNGPYASHYQAIENVYETYNFIQMYLFVDPEMASIHPSPKPIRERMKCKLYLPHLAYAHYLFARNGEQTLSPKMQFPSEYGGNAYATLSQIPWTKMIDIFEFDSNAKEVTDIALKYVTDEQGVKQPVDIKFTDFLELFTKYLDKVIFMFSTANPGKGNLEPSAPLLTEEVSLQNRVVVGTGEDQIVVSEAAPVAAIATALSAAQPVQSPLLQAADTSLNTTTVAAAVVATGALPPTSSAAPAALIEPDVIPTVAAVVIPKKKELVV